MLPKKTAKKKQRKMSHVSRQAADDGRLVYVGNLNDDVRERCVNREASLEAKMGGLSESSTEGLVLAAPVAPLAPSI